MAVRNQYMPGNDGHEDEEDCRSQGTGKDGEDLVTGKAGDDKTFFLVIEVDYERMISSCSARGPGEWNRISLEW